MSKLKRPNTKFQQLDGSYRHMGTNAFKDNYMNEKLKGSSKLLTEEEKEDGTEIRKKFRYYKMLGFSQTKSKAKKISKLENLANGVIDPNDFLNSEEIRDLQTLDPSVKFEEDDIELEYFPIVPNLINRLEGGIDKHYMGMTANAVSNGTVNEILEERNNWLKSKMSELMQKALEGQVEDPKQIQAEIQEKLKYYSVDYRHEIEKWANVVMEIENEKYNLQNLSRKGFRELLIHEEPYYHVNLVDNEYWPELLDSKQCFFLKSKKVQDASNYTMFGWFEYENLNSILSKYQLNAEQTVSLSKWSASNSSIAIDGASMFDGSNPTTNSLKNYRFLQQIESTPTTAYDPNNRLLQVTSIYWLEPKKIGILTVRINGQLSTTKVDDGFKVTDPPKYKLNKKTKENLIEGEHIEWVYINELYKGIEISPSWNMGSIESQDWDQNIFINLGRHPIQYAHKYMRYGIKIPVHGGSVLGWSIASRTYSWQKFYNYLGNRSKQILYTELGKFLLLNQNTLPDTSLDGSWGEDRLLKAFVQAKELSVMMTDNSLINGVGAVNSQGFGQVVDLTKTQEVAEKFQLMRMIKNECLESVGLAGNAVHESSPYQTATSIAQTQDVTITQLSYLFSRHYEIMRSLRETMIETALYLTSKGEYRELNYTTTDKQRVIFKLDIENTLLHDLAIYINNDLNDISNLEKVKQFVVSNNTMGADSMELSEMIHAKTSSELFGRLKTLADRKQKQVDEERKYQSDMQQKQIDAQEKLKKAELDWQANQNELDRVNVLKSAQTKAIGFGDGTPMEILDAEIKLQQLRLKDAELSRNIAMDEFKKSMMQTQHEDNLESNDKKIMNSHEIKLSELELRKKEIEASQQRTNAMMVQSKTDNKKK